MQRVLVTRPEPGASATARRLTRLGFEPVLLPLTRIEALRPGSLRDPASVDAVAVTSANAIRNAPPRLLERLAGKPLLVVGAQTARAAREAGLGPAATQAADARSLALRLRSELKPGMRVLYLAGRERGDELEAGLRDAGCRVEIAEIYDAPAVEIGGDDIRSRLGDAPIDSALVYSPRGGALLAALMGREECGKAFRATRFLAISSRAAEPFVARFPERTRIAATPDEDALLALFGHAE